MEDKNYLKIEYEFQKSLINNDVDFMTKYMNYLKINLGQKTKKLTNNSNDYIYFPKKLNNNKKSILIVLHELSRTGAPVVALDTAKILVENGYFVTLISLKDGVLTEDFIKLGIPVIIYNKYRYSQFSIVGYEYYFNNFEIDTFVNSFNKTIVITAANYNIIKRYIGVKNKIIWWIHEGKDTYDYIGGRMPFNLTKNINVYCGGQYSIDQLNKYGFKYNPKVLNYGIVNKKIVKSKKTNNKIKFLLAGSIGERKGQKILLDAIKKIPINILNQSEFIFVGNTLSGDNKGELIKKEIEDYCMINPNVTYYNQMSRQDIYELYKNIDVLVVPSTDDPMPVVATENLMFENVILCSNNTGTSYYIKDGKDGFIFDINNIDSLVAKISYIIINKDKLKNIGKNGRNIFEKEFDMKIFKNKLLKILEKE